MATLQRFKFLATQCGVPQSPTRSPSPRTSPLVQLRRNKTTLKMLLSLRSPSRREQQPLIHHQKDVSGRKLRDLFVSSSSVDEDEDEAELEKERKRGKSKEEVLAAMAARLNAANSFQCESDAAPVWFGFSKRLLQRAWRPKLGTIPE
ncbi:hypothetical protein V5N11_010875 [Cardamine amara subsp. amara]|uniref:Uncharacterized protein n=1 Tax=Cardamine amara subsp. amara TaxID=228776 RepID=A0ABD1C1P5_CARAN